jgi:hypothetical protein
MYWFSDANEAEMEELEDKLEAFDENELLP